VSTPPLSRSRSFTESSIGLRRDGLVDGGSSGVVAGLEEFADLLGEVVGGGPAELAGDGDSALVSS